MKSSASFRKWVVQSPPVEFLLEHGSAAVKDVLLGALRHGPVPKHIAFVMDGNRRFARSKRQEVTEGHSAGFEALARILEICYKIGVKVVTVYAFSIENFKRSRSEVDNLMDMAKMRLGQLAQHGQLLDKYGAKIQLLGRREMIRPDVLETLDQAMELTRHNTKAVLNICAPYTSRDEMATAIQKTVVQYCQPLRPRLRRPFSETHIARQIEAGRIKSLERATSGMPESTRAMESTEEEDYVYKPSTPGTGAVYQDILQAVESLLDEAADENTATADEEVIAGATSSILVYLKDITLSQEEKLIEVRDILDFDLSDAQLQELQSLADKLTDYQTKTAVSESTTLGNNGEHANASPRPPLPPMYPDIENIDENTLTSHTYTGSDAPPLDLLIRTSGVERLSDFMLWQCHQTTEVRFVDCYWPEFGLWHFVPIILEWQWKQNKETSGASEN
ncbi:Di-trans-poly-cis-decaprenylcistransferase [Microthyrium microscopicum]|uniref:Di-trans-poly-cis-decaprenylcistransferase n=1 Tax=Microthyrium microscopicum TaxID=703497 RepID=A0A6A6URH1_9PEZI|nr:Di-trans-poly-cis-decaprenylcistransferase [Microthyrium microscopicum]